MSIPKVSIITPFYNGAQYIQKCIDGIQMQSFKDFEYIIVDDGSTESENKFLSDIVAKYPNIILISQKNSGQASAVNAGIKIAKGEYVSFCDQDDAWLPEKLKKQTEYLESHSNIGMVYSDALMMDERGITAERTWMQSRGVVFCEGGYENCAKRLFEKNFICAPLVMMIRKKIFYEIGAMNSSFGSIYDYDFLFRYFSRGYQSGFIYQPLAIWRTHPGQSSRNIRKVKREQLYILLSFLLYRKDFLFKYPCLVIKKIALTMGGLISNKTKRFKY